MTRDVAFVALGSNLGDRAEYLARARDELARLPRSRVIGQSSVEETAPIGPVTQGAFLNQMVSVETELTPTELLIELHGIEARIGRVRDERWGPRTIDLDLVTMERQRSNDPRCQVPHPELGRRDFWQRELAELRGASVE